MRPIKYIGGLALLALALGCSGPDRPSDDDHAGGGNRSPNAFGRVVDNTNRVASGAKVTAFRIDPASDQIRSYTWAPVDSTTTDQDGWFGFDSLAQGRYAFTAEKNGSKAFPGYYTLDAQDDTVLLLDTVRLVTAKKIRGTFDYSGNFGNWKIIADSAVMYLSDTMTIQVGLVGTPYRGTVGTDKSFTFDFLPSANYKLEVIYKTRFRATPQDQYYDIYIVNYSVFVADPQHYQFFTDDPLLVHDSVSVAGDSVTIVGANYIIRYSVSNN
jgi:hypothetical protein